MTDDSRHDQDASSNRRQASVFIEKIERDRDRALADIAQNARARVDQIQKRAYASAREFHHAQAEQTRQRCLRRAEKRSARAQARLRRESWRVLRRLQQSALNRLQAQLDEVWADPERQWAWCRFWLQTIRAEAGGQELKITVGRSVKPEVKNRLAAWLQDCPGACTVLTDAAMGHGITIEWGKCLLDGRQEAQYPGLADAVFKRLVNELHDEQERGKP